MLDRKTLIILLAALVLNFSGAAMLLADSGNGLALTALDRYIRAPDDTCLLYTSPSPRD